MPIFGVKSTFLKSGILAVRKRELIIEEVHNNLRHSFRCVACCSPRSGVQILEQLPCDFSHGLCFLLFIPLLPAETHSFEAVGLFFTGKDYLDFVLHRAVITDYQNMSL